jgi:hypothetical protein
VLLTDLFATILELGAGSHPVARVEHARGRSLLRRLRSGRFEGSFVSESSLRPYEHDSSPGVAGYGKAVYADRFKLIYCPEPRRVDEGRPLDERLEIGAAASGSVSSTSNDCAASRAIGTADQSRPHPPVSQTGIRARSRRCARSGTFNRHLGCPRYACATESTACP